MLDWSNSHTMKKPTEIDAIEVRSSAGDYSVLCQRGLLRSAASEIEKLGKFSSVHILSSPKVWRAVGSRVRRGIGSRVAAKVHLFADGEAAKNLRTGTWQ